MAEPTTTRSFRLPTPLLERIERYAQRLQREAPVGIRVSVTATVVHLLTYALDQLEGSSGRAG